MKKSTPWMLMILLTFAFVLVLISKQEEVVDTRKELVAEQDRNREIVTNLYKSVDETNDYRIALEKCKRTHR